MGRQRAHGGAGSSSTAAPSAGQAGGLPTPPHRLGRSVHKLVMSAAPLRRAATALSRYVAESPERSVVRKLLTPGYTRLRGEVTPGELLAVVDALRAGGVDLWLAGGWGVDALLGRQTRRHDDMDIVVDDFDERAPVAAAILARLGFETTRRDRFPLWMPDRWQMRDGSLRTVDLVSVDWSRMLAALERDGEPGPDELPPQTVASAAGTVAGRPVPCLSARVQLLFHSQFEPRAVQRHDLELLETLTATSAAGS
ncbi:MAG: hypothetical protein M0Z33_11775 [Actinomycetota bacterium]|nr:hypothetical protein [Actinomycetota bacterium]